MLLMLVQCARLPRYSTGYMRPSRASEHTHPTAVRCFNLDASGPLQISASQPSPNCPKAARANEKVKAHTHTHLWVQPDTPSGVCLCLTAPRSSNSASSF